MKTPLIVALLILWSSVTAAQTPIFRPKPDDEYVREQIRQASQEAQEGGERPARDADADRGQKPAKQAAAKKEPAKPQRKSP
ncbi:hypothetical protein XH94_37195 [Bradyrhizobium zhanjiangense]|uniref:Uncharacterized protein n=1 Tax=Bradyrhizobium zhanjiangense TaxID=1325107 RepID=A0A4Q0RVN2_9BRAD|nr:hypothetical protein XH94_37195 [Bradyrhizobium zhanjiangense]